MKCKDCKIDEAVVFHDPNGNSIVKGRCGWCHELAVRSSVKCGNYVRGHAKTMRDDDGNYIRDLSCISTEAAGRKMLSRR
jgi:hypothetical protein